MFGYIYKTTCLINNLIYVGKHEASTFDPKYLGSGRDLKLAIKEYKRNNFVVELLDTAETYEELKIKEFEWVAKLDAQNPDVGYNRTVGGNFGSKLFVYIILNNTDIKHIKKADLDTYIKSGWRIATPQEIHIYSSQQFNLQHPDYARNYSKQYKTEHKAEINAKRRARYKLNKEDMLQKNKQWKQDNADRIKAWRKEYDRKYYKNYYSIPEVKQHLKDYQKWYNENVRKANRKTKE